MRHIMLSVQRPVTTTNLYNYVLIRLRIDGGGSIHPLAECEQPVDDLYTPGHVKVVAVGRCGTTCVAVAVDAAPPVSL
ncbi:hypothetical protein Y032_0065g3614 [Ancylostoma ceylanicum]|nr:hypothetical protein Y032_0065g3614 [Ancylostoma ceylanicum]